MGDEDDSSQRVRAQRARLAQLGEKLARLRRGVGALQEAVRELTDEQSQIAGKLERATQAVHECIEVAEGAARGSSAPPGRPATTREYGTPKADDDEG